MGFIKLFTEAQNKHNQPVRRWKKKRYSHGHSTTSIWGDSGFAAQGIVFSRKRKSTQAWSNLNSNLQSFHVVANTLSRFTIFQSRECQRDQTFRFLRLCPRSSSARPSVGTAVHRDSKTFRTNCPILLQCDKLLQLQYATRIKHIEPIPANAQRSTKAHLYHLYLKVAASLSSYAADCHPPRTRQWWR